MEKLEEMDKTMDIGQLVFFEVDLENSLVVISNYSAEKGSVIQHPHYFTFFIVRNELISKKYEQNLINQKAKLFMILVVTRSLYRLMRERKSMCGERRNQPTSRRQSHVAVKHQNQQTG